MIVSLEGEAFGVRQLAAAFTVYAFPVSGFPL
jgi:hypothetical protein